MDVKFFFVVIGFLCPGIVFAENSPAVGVSSGDRSIQVYSNEKNTAKNLMILTDKGWFGCCISNTGKLFTTKVENNEFVSNMAHDGHTAKYVGSLESEAKEKLEGDIFTGLLLQPTAQLVGHSEGKYQIRNNGIVFSVTTCTSQEGINFYISDFKTGKPIDHFYYYLGYDIEPTCK